ncbi:MAG: SDR family oxidoreductase [Actinomycetota bacterium]
MELAGKTTIITGAASGIGEALAESFAAEGASAVIVADRNERGAKAVADRLGPVATGVGLDVADEAAVQAMVADTEAAHGPVDVFVSNAGYIVRGGLELPDDEWTRMMDVHVWSHLYAARAVVPSMAERGEGYILNTASAAGLLTQIDSGPYAVSKHAAVAFAEWLLINYGDKGLKVSVLCPQAVRTNIVGDPDLMGDNAGQAGMDGILEPSEAAQACVDAIRDERFLVLPHPDVETYFQRKASDYDRWLNGMRRFRRRLFGDD